MTTLRCPAGHEVICGPLWTADDADAWRCQHAGCRADGTYGCPGCGKTIRPGTCCGSCVTDAWIAGEHDELGLYIAPWDPASAAPVSAPDLAAEARQLGFDVKGYPGGLQAESEEQAKTIVRALGADRVVRTSEIVVARARASTASGFSPERTDR